MKSREEIQPGEVTTVKLHPLKVVASNDFKTYFDLMALVPSPPSHLNSKLMMKLMQCGVTIHLPTKAEVDEWMDKIRRDQYGSLTLGMALTFENGGDLVGGLAITYDRTMGKPETKISFHT